MMPRHAHTTASVAPNIHRRLFPLLRSLLLFSSLATACAVFVRFRRDQGSLCSARRAARPPALLGPFGVRRRAPLSSPPTSLRLTICLPLPIGRPTSRRPLPLSVFASFASLRHLYRTLFYRVPLSSHHDPRTSGQRASARRAPSPGPTIPTHPDPPPIHLRRALWHPSSRRAPTHTHLERARRLAL